MYLNYLGTILMVIFINLMNKKKKKCPKVYLYKFNFSIFLEVLENLIFFFINLLVSIRTSLREMRMAHRTKITGRLRQP